MATRLAGTLVPTWVVGHVTGFATDDRLSKPGDAFLAIRGENADGHEFVDSALKNGAVITVAERAVSGPYILVENLVESLSMLAKTYREGFLGPVVGVTGSAGKTTTKEFIAAALGSLGLILKTEGNRNSEYTSPLIWPELEPVHKGVVVEMAMRGFGQIRHLAEFSSPTIGVVTNIGFSHLEQVGTREGIARAKGELIECLPSDGVAVLGREDDYLELLRALCGTRRVKTFGYSDDSDCRIIEYKPTDWSSAELSGILNGQPWKAVIPSIGRHIALDAAAAVLVAGECGIDPVVAAAGLGSVSIPPMRMEVREVNGATVLLDTYNASPPAMLAALDALFSMRVTGRKVAVIGEMRELGAYSEDMHRRIGRAIGECGLDAVLFIGANMNEFARPEAISSGLEPSLARVAEDIGDVRRFLAELEPGDAALVKGSRALELERALDPGY